MSDYFRRVTGKSTRAIAQASGIEPTTFNRQMNGTSTVTVETVVAVCREFDIDMAEAFVQAGFITDAEAQRLGAQVGLATFTDIELAREIVRRLENDSATEALTGDLPLDDNVPTSLDDVPVLTREEDELIRKTDLTLAAKRGRNEAEIPFAE